MRESLCLYGLLLLGLLVAHGWAQYDDYYDYCDDPFYYDYYGLCDDRGTEDTTEPTTDPPTEPPVCEFPGPTPPNATK